MNILFYTYYEVDPQKGGTERSTTTTAVGLRDVYGHSIYSAYKERIGVEHCIFEKAYKLGGNYYEDLAKIINDNEIDIVINEGDFFMVNTIYRAIKRSGRRCRSIFVHHYTPGDELRTFEKGRIRSRIRFSKDGIKNLVRYIGFFYFGKRQERLLKEKYRESCELCDKVILLSHRFKDQYLKFADCQDRGNFEFIPNALSLKGFYDIRNYDKKRKTVLIVSRMDETQKKIFRALRIWQLIEKKQEFEDWTLELVGDGPSLEEYCKFAKMYLQRVKFFGRQNPQSFYERASIFLMTSACEGWGLTLTEAQQNGCVPIAFDTYSSLRDIIDNEENGIIVNANDDAHYEQCLQKLMSSTSLRKDMAANAIEKSRKFAPENIIGLWQALVSSECN